MSIKEHALLVSLSVSKPQMTQKDAKATHDAETANNAAGAGQYRKDLYPKHLVMPILTVESSARAYIASTTYVWNRGEFLLPAARIMTFGERMSRYELEFSQAVTAFLNNWTNVMTQAQAAQGALFDANVYPDTTALRAQFRFRVQYRPVTDAADFRVQCQQDELDALRETVEADTRESMAALLAAPLQRLRDVVDKLHETMGKPEREVINKRTGVAEVRPPVFRDSVVENIADEINLLHDFAAVLPPTLLALARNTADLLPHPQQLRDNPEKRDEVRTGAAALLATIDSMLDN